MKQVRTYQGKIWTDAKVNGGCRRSLKTRFGLSLMGREVRVGWVEAAGDSAGSATGDGRRQKYGWVGLFACELRVWVKASSAKERI